MDDSVKEIYITTLIYDVVKISNEFQFEQVVKLKVIQILPELNTGGVEKGTVELASFLASKNHLSQVVSNGGRMVTKLTNEGSRHHQMPIHRKSLLSILQVPKLRKLFAKEKPDVIHVRSRMPAWLTWFAWRSLQHSKRPKLVSTIHGFYSVNGYSKIMTMGEKVICVSESIKEYAKKNYSGLKDENLITIHRGVATETYPFGFEPSLDWKKKWKEKNPHLNEKFLVLLPGRLTRWKGQLDFVKVISTLNKNKISAHGLIVGGAHPRKDHFKKEINSAIKRSGVPNSFTLLGDRSDLREIMSIADAVVSCSTDPEAFGRTTLESLSMGKPTAGYAHGGVREQLEELCPEGMVSLGNYQEMASLLKKWSVRKPMISPNTKFTLSSMLEQTLGLYSSLSR